MPSSYRECWETAQSPQSPMPDPRSRKSQGPGDGGGRGCGGSLTHGPGLPSPEGCPSKHKTPDVQPGPETESTQLLRDRGCPGWGEPHDQPSGQCEALGAKDSLPLSPHPALGDMVSVAQFARLQPLCNQEARQPVAQANPAWRESHEPGDRSWLLGRLPFSPSGLLTLRLRLLGVLASPSVV